MSTEIPKNDKSSPPPRPAPTGAARRRRRRSDVETAERMLAAARDMILADGLTVSLEHLSLEDVIHDAGVARSAAYRRWPYKDLFWADVLVELARGVPPALQYDEAAARAATERMRNWLDRLDEPQNRLAAVSDVLRHGALEEVESFDRSREWRTYFAIQTTFFGLSDGDLRARVQEALTIAEHELITMLAGTYRAVAGLFGLRIRPERNLSFDDLATLAMGIIRGLVLMMPSNPRVSDDRPNRQKPGADGTWTLPGIGLTAVTVDLMEIDPDVTWTPERADELSAALEQMSWVELPPAQ